VISPARKGVEQVPSGMLTTAMDAIIIVVITICIVGLKLIVDQLGFTNDIETQDVYYNGRLSGDYVGRWYWWW